MKNIILLELIKAWENDAESTPDTSDDTTNSAIAAAGSVARCEAINECADTLRHLTEIFPDSKLSRTVS